MTVDQKWAQNVLLRERVVAVIRHERAADAYAIARSCLAGGMRALEVTFTTPDATEILRTLIHEARDRDGVIIGAGSILDVGQVAVAIDAGASFLVSPVTDPDVLAAGAQADTLTVPGAMTPTEVGVARAAGAGLVKVFPAGCVGTGFAGAVRSILPGVHLMPTGGVNEDDVAPWLAAGASVVGIGSALNRAYIDGGEAAVEFRARRLAEFAVANTPEPSATYKREHHHEGPPLHRSGEPRDGQHGRAP